MLTAGTGGGLFNNFAGTLTNNGRAKATWTVPNLVEIAGLRIFFGAFTYDPAATRLIGTVTTWARSLIK